jgi:molecular chaperone GrpE
VIKDKRKIDMSGQAKPEQSQPEDEAKPTMGQPPKPAEPATAAEVTTEEPAETPAPPVESPAEAKPFAAELESMRSELDERLRDLQRVTAEYANYRKRVERDRSLMAEQTVALVVGALLPILDDLDRAREHGDLVGQLATVAEQLGAVLAKFGLAGFGEQGDTFDPTRHEAVAHQTSAEVTEPTCIGIMRRGYLLGERLLRPALVAVADPE